MTTMATFDFDKARAALQILSTAHQDANAAQMALYGVNPLLTAKCSTRRHELLRKEILEAVTAIEGLQVSLSRMVASQRQEIEAICSAALHEFIEVAGLSRIAPPRGTAAPWVLIELQGGGGSLSGAISDVNRIDDDSPEGISVVIHLDEGQGSDSYRLWVRPSGVALEVLEPDVY